MAALTFGSLGDIIAVCEIIANVVEALSETRGSSSQYQGVVRELFSLSQALESVEDLLDRSTAIQNASRLRHALEQCHKCLDTYLRKIQKYQRSLREGGSGNFARDAFRKLRWQSHQEDVSRFQSEISLHVSGVHLILQVFSADLRSGGDVSIKDQIEELDRKFQNELDQLKSQIQQRHVHTQTVVRSEHGETRKEVELAKIETFARLDAQQGILLQIQAISGIGEGLFTRVFDVVEKSSGSRMDETMNQLPTRLETLLIQQRLPNELHKTWTQSPLTIEDMIGRRFPVHPEFISSFKILCSVVKDNSQSEASASLMKSGNFAFEDENNQLINSDDQWRKTAQSGSRVFIRPYFWYHFSETETAKCGICDKETLRGSGTISICFACQANSESHVSFREETVTIRVSIQGLADSYSFGWETRLQVSKGHFKQLLLQAGH